MTRINNRESGFILPLAVLLVLVLSISGMGFLQLDFLERKMTLNNLDNHGAFYVANAGVERAREVLKIPDTLSWTTVLNGASPYATDPAPNALLCPFAATRGCVILPFGSAVASPDNLVFGGTFDDGQYTVRAYNNVEESGKTDGDQMLMVRALGTVRNDQKLLETRILATSGVNLINCDHTPCPGINGNPTIDAAPGREPAYNDATQVGPNFLPTLDFKLTDSRNYYRQASNFSSFAPNVKTTLSGQPQSNTYYSITGNVTLANTPSNISNVVIFATGTVNLNNKTTLTNSIIIGATGVTLQGQGTISAPLPYPAIITEGGVTGGGAKQIVGTVFAARPRESGKPFNGTNGTIDVNPINVKGVLIANIVNLQGGQGNGSTTITDDHANDPNYTKYYALMPGFVYRPELKTTTIVSGNWREIQ